MGAHAQRHAGQEGLLAPGTKLVLVEFDDNPLVLVGLPRRVTVGEAWDAEQEGDIPLVSLLITVGSLSFRRDTYLLMTPRQVRAHYRREDTAIVAIC